MLTSPRYSTQEYWIEFWGLLEQLSGQLKETETPPTPVLLLLTTYEIS